MRTESAVTINAMVTVRSKPMSRSPGKTSFRCVPRSGNVFAERDAAQIVVVVAGFGTVSTSDGCF
jgi:hypothetical protein